MNNRNINPDLDEVYSSISDSVDEYYSSLEGSDYFDGGAAAWISEDLLDYSVRGVEAIRV